MTKPANTIFSSLVILGTLISVSANSWFLAWFGLEMNLIGFIPLLVSNNNIKSPEAAIKYFFIQGASSSLLIISTLYIVMSVSNSILALLALMVKLGAAPCHFWLPNLLESISWNNSCMLLTWQKINPLFLVTLSAKSTMLFYILMSLIFGSIMGFNQSSTKKILAFSSISHLAWILTAAKLNSKILYVYFLSYSIMVIILMAMLKVNNSNSINKTLMIPPSMKIYLYLSLLSLGGMPPLLGFFPKAMVIMMMINNTMVMLPMALILSSLINLYFYLRLTYTMLVVHSTSTSYSSNINSNYFMVMLILGPLIPLVF